MNELYVGTYFVQHTWFVSVIAMGIYYLKKPYKLHKESFLYHFGQPKIIRSHAS